jgi:hypothetical protein
VLLALSRLDQGEAPVLLGAWQSEAQMKRVRDWYQRRGYLQFLLGNCWHEEDAVYVMAFCWALNGLAIALASTMVLAMF